MIQIISFAIGAGITSYTWYKTSSKKESEEITFIGELMPYLKVLSIVLAGFALIVYLKRKRTE